jgi:hypothetical protein
MVGDFFGLGFAIVMSALVSCFVVGNPLPILGMFAMLYALSYAGGRVEKAVKKK